MKERDGGDSSSKGDTSSYDNGGICRGTMGTVYDDPKQHSIEGLKSNISFTSKMDFSMSKSTKLKCEKHDLKRSSVCASGGIFFYKIV